MNKQTNQSVLLRFIKATFMAALPALVLMFSIQVSQAGSATWNLNPASDLWSTASNWTPATVPNGPATRRPSIYRIQQHFQFQLRLRLTASYSTLAQVHIPSRHRSWG